MKLFRNLRKMTLKKDKNLDITEKDRLKDKTE